MHNGHPKVVVAWGGFDPIHSGHIEYLKEAKALGDRLIVALASDHALIQKKKNVFLKYEDRIEIIKNLRMVDDIIFIDDYYNHYEDALAQLRKRYPTATIVFACGSEQTKNNSPYLKDQDVVFEYNVGGPRVNRSSDILRTFGEYSLNVKDLEAGPNGRYS